MGSSDSDAGGDEGKGNMLPMIIGGVVVVAILAIGGYFLLCKPGGDPWAGVLEKADAIVATKDGKDEDKKAQGALKEASEKFVKENTPKEGAVQTKVDAMPGLCDKLTAAALAAAGKADHADFKTAKENYAKGAKEMMEPEKKK
jgi:hypothetical protein